MSSKKSNLADKINSLITAAPENFGSDDETEDTRAKIVERYEESESDEGLTSSIRRQNIDLLDEVDERYKGKKVSRKDLYGEESSDEEEAEESEASEGSSDDKNAEESSEGDTVEGSEPEEDENEDEEESNDEEDAEVDEDNPLRRNRDPSINFKNLNTRNLHRDIDKGQAVREQLKLWEHLLEMRIQFQKCLVTSNQLPQFDSYKKFTPDKEFVKNKDETTSKLTNLLEGLLQVQEKLFRNNSETKSLLSKKKRRGKRRGEPHGRRNCFRY
uniref:Aatf protein n=1 Tax=Fopius arisanus TaxID=64838 RepID=A0A0C9QJW3_9HYME